MAEALLFLFFLVPIALVLTLVLTPVLLFAGGGWLVRRLRARPCVRCGVPKSNRIDLPEGKVCMDCLLAADE